MILTEAFVLSTYFCAIHATETFDMLYFLVERHAEICAPINSKCYPSLLPRFPRNAESYPPDFLRRHTNILASLSTVVVGGLCCGFCSCDKACWSHGSCCLHQYESFNHGRLAIQNTRFSCIVPEHETENKFKAVKSVWMVTKCDKNTRNRTVKELCESPGNDEQLDTLVPVRYDGIDYKNKYCAFCNDGIIASKSLKNWKLEISCRELLTLPDKNILKTLKEKKCGINYNPPDNILADECRTVPFTISSCNVTGKWKQYDERIELGCGAFIDPFNLTYMNYFCYLCNTEERPPGEPVLCERLAVNNIVGISPPFSAILNVDVINSMMQDDYQFDCNPNTQFKDDKMMLCRDIYCDKDRYLHNDKCIVDDTKTDFPCYSVFIKLTLRDTDLSLDDVQEASFISSIETHFVDIIPDFSRSVLRFEIFYKDSTFDSPDQHDSLVVHLSLNPLFYAASEPLSQLFKLHKTMMIIDHNQKPKNLFSECVFYNTSTIRQREISENRTTSSDFLTRIYAKQMSGVYIDICPDNKLIPAKKLHLCPFTKLKLSELSNKIEGDFLYITENFAENTSFSQWEYELSVGHILMCLDDYLSISRKMSGNKFPETQPEKRIHPKQIVSLICTCLSVCCLLVTIVTYLMFYDFQSQPSINNVILCVCLVMAQLLYQFGAGQSSLPSWACVVIGFLCHFLWLAVMFSMNICCIQMFRIFRSPTKLSARFNFKITLKYLLYIIISSFVLVGVNVIVSLAGSNGADSGYGGALCYVSSILMHLVTFIIPSAITIAVNIILFAYVVFSINRTSTKSAKITQERNYFGAYARLSSLTGLTWIFGYLFILLQNETLEYLFIVCNASQGVFIMIAFVLNQRTYNIFCKERKGLDKTMSTTVEHETNSMRG